MKFSKIARRVFLLTLILSISFHLYAADPVVTSVTISPEGPYVPSTMLIGAYSYFDADGDLEDLPADRRWYSSSNASGTPNTYIFPGSTYQVSNAQRGNYIAHAVRVHDTSGASSQFTFSQWYKVNTRPSVSNNNYPNWIEEGGVLNVAAGAGVLANDSDPDAQTLSAVIDTEPQYGTLTLNADGGFVYTHDGSENHNDIFSYRAFDGMEYSESTASVFISVSPVNDAPEFTTTAPTSAQQGQLYEYNIVTTDPENNTRAITSNNTLPSFLELQDDENGTGRLFGTPQNGDDGTYNISLRVNDFNGGITDYNYTLTVSDVDDPPVLAGIELQPLAYEEGETSKPITQSLTVDDPDNDNIISATFTFTSGYVNTDDRLNYNPTSGFTWSPNFGTGVYVLSGEKNEADYQSAIRNVTYNSNTDNPVEGNRTLEIVVTTAGASSNAVSRIITVTGVNDPPEAVPDVYPDIPEGGSFTAVADDGVLDNDTDPDDPPSALTAQLISTVSFGTLNFNTNGSFTYTHNGSEELSDGFTYNASDGQSTSDIVTVTLNMVPVNDPPVLINMETATLEFIEDGTAKQLTNQVLVSDEDNANLQSATITIDQGFVSGEDSLTFLEETETELAVNYNYLTGLITVTGNEPVATYQTFLRNIRYINTNTDNPNVTQRRVSFVVNDGEADSDPVYREIAIVAENDPPVAENTTLDAANFYVGDVTTILYDYSDPENDDEGNTTYKWFSSASEQGTNPSQLASWNVDTFTLTFDQGGQWVRGIVTPRDEFDAVGLNDASDWVYVNAAPEFDPFTVVNLVNPGAFAVGETVTANYSYSDLEGDDPGTHIFQWYESTDGNWDNATPIAGANNTELELIDDFDGLFIALRGTPIAESGSSPGITYSLGWSPVSYAPGASIENLDNDSICSDSTGYLKVTLNGKAPYSFKYYIEGNIDTFEVSGIPIEDANYQLEVSQEGIYKLSDVKDDDFEYGVGIVSGEAKIAYYPQPTAEFLIDEISICDNDEGNYEIPVIFTGTAPWDISYQYSGSAQPATIEDLTESSYSILVGAEDDGDYSLMQVVDAHCTAAATGTATVSLKENPKATLLTSNTTVCANEDVDIQVSLEGNGPWKYFYSYNDGDLDSITVNQNTSAFTHTFTVNTPGSYRLVRVVDEDDEGCAYGTVEIDNYMLPTATITGNDSVCEGASKSFPVQLTGQGPWNIVYQENTEEPDTIKNITATPYQLSTKVAGNYTILSVEDEHCIGSGSGIANLKVNPLPEVSIFDMDTIYSLEADSIPIFVEPEGGSFAQSDVPLAIQPPADQGYKIFHTAIATVLGGENYSPQWIRYTYDDSVTGCSATAEHIMYLLAEPIEIQLSDSIYKNKEMFCFNDDPIDIVAVTEFRNDTGSFTISGAKGLLDKGDNKAILYPEDLRTGQKTVTYRVEVNGEMLEATKTFSFEEIYGNFSWDNECFFDGAATVTFNDNSASSNDVLSGYSWRFFMEDDTLEFGADSAISPTVTFNALDNYNIEYVLTSQSKNDRCYDTVTTEFVLKPTRDVGNMPYDESFSNGEGYWSHSRLNANVISRWKFGKPEGGVWDDIQASESAWYTQIDTVTNADDSYIISPCFDFTNAERPMIKMDLWRRFSTGQNDGAILEYTTDNGIHWHPVGSIGDGINWYNSINILGTPGNQNFGWADAKDNDWVNVRHKLDYSDLMNSKRVRFRIAYGAIPDQFPPRQGLAVDNIWIGERTKKVLVEHFTNSSNELAAEVNPDFNALLNSVQHKKDVIDIQYHLGEPTYGFDPFHELSEVAVNSRSNFYDISSIPYSVIDGGKQDLVDYQDKDELDPNILLRAALVDNLFDINLEESFLGSNYLDISLKLTANQNIEVTEASLQVAIIELNIDGVTGDNGETEFKSVLKAMVPSAIGTPIKSSWNANENHQYNLSYDLEGIYDVKQLRYVVFVQNDITKEVYQTEMYDPNVSPNGLITPEANNAAPFTVSPNPTQNNSSIFLQTPYDKEVSFEILSSSGGLISGGTIPAGVTDQVILLNGLKPGMYYIKLQSDQQILGTRKLVKIGNNR